MKRLAVFFLFLSLSAFAEPIHDPINYIEGLNLDGYPALVFSAELNIENGSPYTRDYGERGMFGRLVFGTDDLSPYLDKADAIFAEAKRLLIGPLKGDGETELEFCTVGKGKELNLQTGEWVRSKGGSAVRVIHITEYKGIKRMAYILMTGTLWRSK